MTSNPGVYKMYNSDKEVIYAEGFSSDPNFNDYTLKKISGKMLINIMDN